MESNIYSLFWAALIPIIIGSIWYNPKVFGKMWLKSANISQMKTQGPQRLLKILITYFLGLLVAFTLMGITVHQLGVMQVLLEQPGFHDDQSEVFLFYQNFMADYGNAHRDIYHGMLHGATVSVTFAFPLIATIALFEKRGWRYVWIHFGYWTVTLTLMSGLICHFF